MSGDLLERALFSFGRAVHSSFTTAVAEGKARLDFRRPENREFWLAGWRYITNLGQRGTWRTAYEWAKLLLSLDPENDPLCIALVLDQMALRAGQATHLLKLIECSFFSRRWLARANIAISNSLAEYKNKEHSRSEHQLKRAISTYPWIFVRLFQELNIERIPKSIWGKSPRSRREKFDCEFYVHGSKDLWNTPETIAFLIETAESASTSILPPEDERPITRDEARHVLLTGSPLLIGLLPEEFTQMSTTSSDPLPPPDNRESYRIVPRLEGHEDDFEDFDDLDDLPDLPNLQPRAGEIGPEEQGSQLLSLQAFISRLVPWHTNGETGPSQLEDPHQESPDTVATSSDAPPEELTERGTRLMAVLRRSISRHTWIDPARFEQMLMGVDVEPGSPIRSDVEFILPNGAVLGSNDGPSGSLAEQTPEQHPAVYDDERNQRWLAGQGMIKLRDFVAEHGADQAAWTPAEVARDGRVILEEYARNALSLAQQRTRKFILDYVLRQGTSVEVQDMVLKEIERLKEGGQ